MIFDIEELKNVIFYILVKLWRINFYMIIYNFNMSFLSNSLIKNKIRDFVILFK